MRVLEVCVDLDGGGIDRYLLNYCSRIKDIDFDFAIVDNHKIGILEKPLEDLGCRIFRVPRITKGVSENFNALKKIMTDTSYDAVHIHLGYKSIVALKAAKSAGIRTRIVHAHIASIPESKKQTVIRKLLTPRVRRAATSLAACGTDAAKWVWGEKAFRQGKVMIHNNAIESKNYAYSSAKRQEVRQREGIAEGQLLVGHVGRLCDQKNQLRLLDIFAEIVKLRSDAVLWLVGRGEQEAELKKRAAALDIEKQVRLLGVRDDVRDLLNAMDVFVFPSKYEGLPFTLIETQCNGLPAVSSTAVTAEVAISDCVEFCALSTDNAEWAKRAVALAERGHDAEAWQSLISAGYDIDTEAAKLRDYYIERVCANGVKNNKD